MTGRNVNLTDQLARFVIVPQRCPGALLQYQPSVTIHVDARSGNPRLRQTDRPRPNIAPTQHLG